MGAARTRRHAIVVADEMAKRGFIPDVLVNVGVGSAPERTVWRDRYPDARWIGIDPRPQRIACPTKSGRYIQAAAVENSGDVLLLYCRKCMSLFCMIADHPPREFVSGVVLDDVLCLPVPVQRPRIPIWVAGRWPNKRPMRRAARWDGVIPILPGTENGQVPSAADVRQLVHYIAGRRADADLQDQVFDVVIGGATPTPAAYEQVMQLADAGATWWDEQMPFDDNVGKLDPILRRIEQGPPRA